MNEEERASAMLDGEEQAVNEEQGEEEKDEKPITDPLEMLSELCSGTFKLMKPFRAHSQDVTELRFDMCAMTGSEIIETLDSVPGVNNVFAISNEQAMAIFAASAAKCAPMIEDGSTRTRLYDAKDIKKRMGAVDCVKAVQLAKLFYGASSQAGSRNISNG